MRIDHQSTIATIQRSLYALQDPKSPGDFAARIYDLTTILFENHLANAALDAVLEGRTHAPDALERFRVSFVRDLDPGLRAIADLTLSIFGAVRPAEGPRAQHERDKHKSAADNMTKQLRYGGANPQLREILEELRQSAFIELLTLEKLEHLSNTILSNARAVVQTLREIAPPNLVGQFDSAYPPVEAQVQRLTKRLRFVDTFVKWASLRPVVGEYRGLHDELKAILENRVDTQDFVPSHRLEQIASKADDAATIKDLQRLASLAEARLHFGAVEQHTLLRLKSHLQHFGKRDLERDLEEDDKRAREENRKAEEAGKKPTAKRQFEKIVQTHVERFVFSDGLFPLVHLTVEGSTMDVFFAEQGLLFAEVRETHQQPVLVELKQELRGQVTAQKLLATVKEARAQATVYADGVRTQFHWRDHRVTALVVYDGPRRFKSRDDDVVLVYLGGAKASDGTEYLEEAAEAERVGTLGSLQTELSR